MYLVKDCDGKPVPERRFRDAVTRYAGDGVTFSLTGRDRKAVCDD